MRISSKSFVRNVSGDRYWSLTFDNFVRVIGMMKEKLEIWFKENLRAAQKCLHPLHVWIVSSTSETSQS